ncbi:OST-HTH/LOTUS domain-containing protein [Sinorhizobium fredii]|uniref:OST-HTH/LOTUS domain-containing protein n=1 Tax=Rhizobium fredii TaxID=380 RepID=UPI001F1BA98C|nr:OST-HTH/LOTUS domain-containing protein [Sinorhizobium fredii]
MSRRTKDARELSAGLPQVRVHRKPAPSSHQGEQSTASAEKPLQPVSAAVPLIEKVLSQEETEDGWVNLGTVGKQLLNLAPDFDPRTFGFRKLSDLVRKSKQREVKQAEGGPISIRLKQRRKS